MQTIATSMPKAMSVGPQPQLRNNFKAASKQYRIEELQEILAYLEKQYKSPEIISQIEAIRSRIAFVRSL